MVTAVPSSNRGTWRLQMRAVQVEEEYKEGRWASMEEKAR
jgi:hypothetical protein